MQRITPFFWFDDNAEEAVNLYVSLFPDSSIESLSRYPEGSPGIAGKVMTISYKLFGQEFMALNGGPIFTFSSAISMLVSCDTQEEVDKYWDTLLEGGQPSQCGWLTDRFGVTWQIVPKRLGELLQQEDKEKSQRVLQAMLQMIKLDIAGLERASEG